MDFLLVLIELLSLGVTTEALQTHIDWKSAFFARMGWALPRFSGTRV